jgi:5'(3')-deoxyribonucleotidase
MRLNEVTDTDVNKMVFLFGELLKICKEELDFDKLPRINWVSDSSYGTKFHSFGSFQPDAGIVTVSITGRHIIDMMRTLAHELVHYKQMLDGRLTPNAGETGSPIENEANAMAGVIMRKFDHKYPEAFSIKPIMEDTRAKLNRLLAEGPPVPQSRPTAQKSPRPAAPTPATPAPPEDNFATGVAKGIGAAVDPRNWFGSGPDKQLQQNVKNVVQNPNQGNVGNVVGQAVVNNAPGTGNVKNAAAAAGNAVDAVKNVAKGDIKGAANSAIDAGTNALGAVAPLAGTVAGGAVSLFRNSTPAQPGNYPSDQNNEDQAISELNDLLAEHSVEIGHIYGNKKLPKTRDKIHSADKGKVHRGLRISEVVGTGTPEVYVDMDGVLADFFKDWNRMVGVGHWKEIKDPEAALDMIRKNPTFWIDLDVLSNAPRLLGAIKKFANSYYICTSPLGKDPNCEPQKREWAKKYLSAFAPKEVYVTHNKPQFAVQPDGTPNVLIDDFGKNIVAWQNAGGIGIHYENNNVESAIKQLKVAMSSNHPQTNDDQPKLATAFQGKSTDL